MTEKPETEENEETREEENESTSGSSPDQPGPPPGSGGMGGGMPGAGGMGGPMAGGMHNNDPEEMGYEQGEPDFPVNPHDPVDADNIPDDQDITAEQIIEALKECYDPEIPVNLYDLGLIYYVDLSEPGRVNVKMTLTAPGCGFGPQIRAQVQNRLEQEEEVEEAEVSIVTQPRWDKSQVTEEGKEQLGMMGF